MLFRYINSHVLDDIRTSRVNIAALPLSHIVIHLCTLNRNKLEEGALEELAINRCPDDVVIFEDQVCMENSNLGRKAEGQG